jgi:hypothetical protein
MPSMHDKKLPATTWGRLKEACSVPAGATVPWMNSLEMDMLDAANERALSGTEAAFQSKIKIYRAILSRHVLYENGSHKFEILFVETLRRKLLGKQETSLMFAGLIVATRFRFAYLEEPDTISAKFSPDAANNEFDRNCWQLRYDFGRLQQEAVELGILDPGAFIAAFGETRRALAEDLLRTSIEGRKRLLAVLPLPGERVLANKRADVSECILEYMRDMEPVNTRFISATLDMFRELLSTETSQPQ